MSRCNESCLWFQFAKVVQRNDRMEIELSGICESKCIPIKAYAWLLVALGYGTDVGWIRLCRIVIVSFAHFNWKCFFFWEITVMVLKLRVLYKETPIYKVVINNHLQSAGYSILGHFLKKCPFLPPPPFR